MVESKNDLKRKSERERQRENDPSRSISTLFSRCRRGKSPMGKETEMLVTCAAQHAHGALTGTETNSKSKGEKGKPAGERAKCHDG